MHIEMPIITGKEHAVPTIFNLILFCQRNSLKRPERLIPEKEHML